MTDQYVPDPQVVRELAAGLIDNNARRTIGICTSVSEHVSWDLRDNLPQDDDERETLYDAVAAAVETAEVAVSWPDENTQDARDDSGAVWLAERNEELRDQAALDLRAITAFLIATERADLHPPEPFDPNDHRGRAQFHLRNHFLARIQDAIYADSQFADPAAPIDAALPALLTAVEVVLLDHQAEIGGDDVDPNISELAHRLLAVAGDDVADEIRDAVKAGAAEAT